MLKTAAIEGLARLRAPERRTEIDAASYHESNQAVLLAIGYADVMLANLPVDGMREALLNPKLHAQAFQYLLEVAGTDRLAVRQMIQDPDARIRGDVIGALGLALDPGAIALIEPLAQDRDPQVVKSVERALARLRAEA
jgi:hypothetical protein